MKLFASLPFLAALTSPISADLITMDSMDNFDFQTADNVAAYQKSTSYLDCASKTYNFFGCAPKAIEEGESGNDGELCSEDNDCEEGLDCKRGWFAFRKKCKIPETRQLCFIQAASEFSDNFGFDEWVTRIFRDSGVNKIDFLNNMGRRNFEDFQRTNVFKKFEVAFNHNPPDMTEFRKQVSDCHGVRDRGDDEVGFDTLTMVGIHIEAGALFNTAFSAFFVAGQLDTPTGYVRGTFGAKLGGGGKFALLVGIPFTKEKNNIIGNGVSISLDAGAGPAVGIAAAVNTDTDKTTLELTFGLGAGAGFGVGYTITGFTNAASPTVAPTPAPSVQCSSPTRIFTVIHDQEASERGYYKFAECDGVNPTLLMERNILYTFLQTDLSNYYHPMGFAYGPDGALNTNDAGVIDEADELTPDTSKGTCDADALTCPAPMYFNNDIPFGAYSNDVNVRHQDSTTDPTITTISTGENADADFGLDSYEPQFFFPLPDWGTENQYSIKLKYDDDGFTEDFFYFCHIHQFMSGRIKLVDSSGTLANSEDTPALGYEFGLNKDGYEDPGSYDDTCGTFGLDLFQLPNDECPSRFVCGDRGKFAGCIESMNCAMIAGMTTSRTSNSDIALFIHQMIPHHQNAVNMAKALLHTGDIDCTDVSEARLSRTASKVGTACTMYVLAQEIIATQNFQIQGMRAILANEAWPDEDDCVVPVQRLL